MEKKGYTETLEWLQKLYPDRATISVKEAAKAMDASDRTVYDAVERQAQKAYEKAAERGRETLTKRRKSINIHFLCRNYSFCVKK